MRIAIIGGGASGLVAAYLLNSSHSVHIFERDNILGGNIRTIGGNVSGDSKNSSQQLENGVLGFHVESYPNFHRLMNHLNMTLYQQNCSSGLYDNGMHLPANSREARKRLTPLRRPGEFLRAIKVALSQKKFWRRSEGLNLTELEKLSFEDFSPTNKTLREFIQGILMISYSTPFGNVDKLPASLTIPFLQYLNSTSLWSFVEGGVYAYVDRMLESFSGQISLNAEVQSISRSNDKVRISVRGAEPQEFDRVVIATTPGVVLSMLEHPTAEETEVFSPWSDRKFRSVLHCDDSIYQRYGKTHRTPMDVFIAGDGRNAGYNTFLNEVYRIPGEKQYSFQYGLDQMINPKEVIHSHEHPVPVYTSEAYATRHAIIAMSGRNNTHFSGAYLGNGLHEGAVTSGMRVADELGGMEI